MDLVKVLTPLTFVLISESIICSQANIKNRKQFFPNDIENSEQNELLFETVESQIALG